ncbi:MAG: hypothetical protein AB9869_11520 [Verrucomicrobiia bacterium]
MRKLAPDLSEHRIADKQTVVTASLHPNNWLNPATYASKVGARLINAISQSRGEVVILDAERVRNAQRTLRMDVQEGSLQFLAGASEDTKKLAKELGIRSGDTYIVGFETKKMGSTWVWADKEKEESTHNIIPKHIELGHELIHSLVKLQKQADPPDVLVTHKPSLPSMRGVPTLRQETIPGNEALVIGVRYPGSELPRGARFEITENTLRASLGLPERLGWKGFY